MQDTVRAICPGLDDGEGARQGRTATPSESRCPQNWFLPPSQTAWGGVGMCPREAVCSLTPALGRLFGPCLWKTCPALPRPSLLPQSQRQNGSVFYRLRSPCREQRSRPGDLGSSLSPSLGPLACLAPWSRDQQAVRAVGGGSPSPRLRAPHTGSVAHPSTVLLASASTPTRGQNQAPTPHFQFLMFFLKKPKI